MAKISWNPGTMVYPLPAVMVSCGATPDEHNIITVAWTGTINSTPPMCYISLRPARHSYPIIKKNRDFVINLTTEELSYATDWCGVKSGKVFNKFEQMNLTPMPAQKVKSPLIKESPLNIECKVTQIISLGSHDMFLAEVVAVNAEEAFLDKESGAFSLQKAGLMAYSHGNYYTLGKELGRFGYSVMKPKTKKRIEREKGKK